MNEQTNIQALKRSLNMLAKKTLVTENSTLTEAEIKIINEYPEQKELWSLYKLSQNQFTSFKEMIIGF